MVLRSVTEKPRDNSMVSASTPTPFVNRRPKTLGFGALSTFGQTTLSGEILFNCAGEDGTAHREKECIGG